MVLHDDMEWGGSINRSQHPCVCFRRLIGSPGIVGHTVLRSGGC
jgi:hypothetical protein